MRFFFDRNMSVKVWPDILENAKLASAFHYVFEVTGGKSLKVGVRSRRSAGRTAVVRNGLGAGIQAAGTLNGHFRYASQNGRQPLIAGEIALDSLRLTPDSGKPFLVGPVRLRSETPETGGSPRVVTAAGAAGDGCAGSGDRGRPVYACRIRYALRRGRQSYPVKGVQQDVRIVGGGGPRLLTLACAVSGCCPCPTQNIR